MLLYYKGSDHLGSLPFLFCAVYLPTCPDSYELVQMQNRGTYRQKITAFSLRYINQKGSEYSRPECGTEPSKNRMGENIIWLVFA